MSLKLRILTQDGRSVSAASTTEELLTVLFDSQMRAITLNQDEEDSLRGWLLMRAQDLNNGEVIALDEKKAVCIGKSADGQCFIRDLRGDWPPLKPHDENPFA